MPPPFLQKPGHPSPGAAAPNKCRAVAQGDWDTLVDKKGRPPDPLQESLLPAVGRALSRRLRHRRLEVSSAPSPPRPALGTHAWPCPPMAMLSPRLGLAWACRGWVAATLSTCPRKLCFRLCFCRTQAVTRWTLQTEGQGVQPWALGDDRPGGAAPPRLRACPPRSSGIEAEEAGG